MVLQNVGAVDAAARLCVSALATIGAMDALVYFDGATAWIGAGVLAGVGLLAGFTGVRRWCPLYRALHTGTLRTRADP